MKMWHQRSTREEDPRASY